MWDDHASSLFLPSVSLSRSFWLVLNNISPFFVYTHLMHKGRKQWRAHFWSVSVIWTAAQFKKPYVKPPCPLSCGRIQQLIWGISTYGKCCFSLREKVSNSKLILLGETKTAIITKDSWEVFINVFAPQSRSLLLEMAETTQIFDALQILMTSVSFRRKQMILRITVTENK